MSDLPPDYIMQDSFDWASFEAFVSISITGRVIESLDDEKFDIHGAKGVTLERGVQSSLEWEEMLHANIIQIDGFLHDTYNERFPREFDLGDGRRFIPQWDHVTLSFGVPRDELKKAARERGKEDAIHHCYVLGNWAYLARNADHVDRSSTKMFVTAFEESLGEDPTAPEDATYEEYGGGSR